MSDVDPRIDSIVEARIAEGVEARLKEEREKAAHEALTEEDILKRPDLVPVYEEGVLVRCDRTMRPYGGTKKGIAG